MKMAAGASAAAAQAQAQQPPPALVKPYLAMVVQSKVISAKGKVEVHRNLEHVLMLIDQYMKGVWQLSGGGAPKLVVFPESFLHGYGPMKTRTYEGNSQL